MEFLELLVIQPAPFMGRNIPGYRICNFLCNLKSFEITAVLSWKMALSVTRTTLKKGLIKAC